MTTPNPLAIAYYLTVTLANGATIGGQTPIGCSALEAINGNLDALRFHGIAEITISEQPTPLRGAGKDTK